MKSTIPIPPLAPSQLIRHPFANILLLDWAEAVTPHVHDAEEPSNARESDGPTHIPSPNVALLALYSRFHHS